MARPVTGLDHLEAARALLKSAKTADELRLAQSVLLPLELGFSLEQTAAAIGRSKGATSAMRARFFRVLENREVQVRRKTDLRNRATVDLDREREILDEILAEVGIAAPVTHFKPVIEARLGKTVALSTIYRMLARHGWRR